MTRPRFLITDPENIEAQPNFFIQTIPGKTNSTIMIDNSGIRMITNELVNNHGKIAQVGMEAMIKGGDFCMIEQYGVDFYVAHVVSDKACVVSKNNDVEQYIWESAAGGSFTEQKGTVMVQGEVKRGTKIICYLKQAQFEFLEDLVKKHFECIGYPIELYVEKSKEKEVTDSEEPLWKRKSAESTGGRPNCGRRCLGNYGRWRQQLLSR